MKNDIIRVLLANDDEEDCNNFVETFECLRIKTIIQTVKNGIELMECLNESSAQLPHLLFIDLNMPGKSGLQCLTEIKQNERLKNLILVIYSNSSCEKDIEDSFLKGANVYIQKPGNIAVLKKTLSHVLTIYWQYYTSGLNRTNFLMHL